MIKYIYYVNNEGVEKVLYYEESKCNNAYEFDKMIKAVEEFGAVEGGLSVNKEGKKIIDYLIIEARTNGYIDGCEETERNYQEDGLI